MSLCISCETFKEFVEADVLKYTLVLKRKAGLLNAVFAMLKTCIFQLRFSLVEAGLVSTGIG